MSTSRNARVATLLAAVVVGRGALCAPPIEIRVDATEAPRRIFHAKLVIPASPGPLTLLYPKWLPGEHGPSGPITDLAGLEIRAKGAAIPWRRDPLEMFAFRVEVPGGATSIEVSLDYLSPTSTEGFSSAASANDQTAVLSWNQLLLYPDVPNPGALPCVASLRLPAGWKLATALGIESEGGKGVEFSETSLRTLIDSPVAMGAHHRAVPLAPSVRPTHSLEIFADSERALEIPDELRTGYDHLVDEALALFGARHYERYRFLLTLSDSLAHFGLEHHESSDNRSYERALVDPDYRRVMIGLLPHEFVHSWNGKFRRPADLTVDDFRKPCNTDLLWVYEGLTSFLGDVLAARSGLRTLDEARDQLASLAAGMEHSRGRTWRPLVDTAVTAQLLFQAPDAWRSWRRDVDFYDEGVLIWLEADTILRRESQGKRSMDDFCRRFHGGTSGPAEVKPYTFDELVSTMNEVAPYDWRAFFRGRLDATSLHAPLAGIAAAGYKLEYDEERAPLLKSREEVREYTDVSFSIGISIAKDGTVIDAVAGLPAASAGVGPGMKLVAVDGMRFTKERLRDAIRGAKTRKDPIVLLMQTGEFFRSFSLDYHGGERYPHLVRVPGKPDLLAELLRARAR